MADKTIAEMRAFLESYGWQAGDREPRLNTKYPGRYMVVEPYEESELPTEDGANGPWCIVGDDLDTLITEAYGVLRSMVGATVKPFVQWYLTGHGYNVTVYDGECQPLKEYTAGDHPLDSQSVAVHDKPLPESTLIEYARRSAREMADEFGIPHDRISRDTDSENDLAEERER